MTAPAITLTGQQSRLALAIAPDKAQATITVPYAAALCTRTLALEDKTFATSDPTIQDIVSCDGQNLSGEIITAWRGAFSCSFLANSQDVGWALATTFGTATAPSAVGASTAVFTLTSGTATGGTYALLFDGKPTGQLAFNANAAAIQAAIDALLGAGLFVVGGTGPWTITAAGANLLTYVRRPRISPASSVTLTGGTVHTLVTTTAGGPARKSYTITVSTEDQPPAITAVLGYTNSTKAWLLGDLTVDSLTFELQASGFVKVTINYIWSGFYQLITGFTWPACATPRKMDIKDSQFLFGAADKTTNVKTVSWTFSNNIQIVYATVSKFGQAFIRQFPLSSVWKVGVEEDVSLAGSVYGLAVANTQEGTTLAFTAQLGDSADGAGMANAESKVRLDGAAQTFGGTPPVGRVPVLVRAFNSDSSATKPTSATVLTTYATGYLASA